MITVRTRDKVIREGKKKILFWFSSCLFVLSFGFYIYSVNATAWNGVQWEKTEEKARVITSVIGELEAEYFARKKDITLSLAYERGFQDTRSIVFLKAEQNNLVSLR